ncbi:MAG: hypothetical protein J4431_04635 [Candidatus Aenigmarchaeota archaeon]|nr:hypothetical protein [Candidatus Aenigmarchaeota archaeon]
MKTHFSEAGGIRRKRRGEQFYSAMLHRRDAKYARMLGMNLVPASSNPRAIRISYRKGWGA